jgi:hypothetical protein
MNEEPRLSEAGLLPSLTSVTSQTRFAICKFVGLFTRTSGNGDYLPSTGTRGPRAWRTR